MTPLDQAKKALGYSKDLARRLGVTPQAISQWKNVPASRVIAVERATGVSRHDLRPDLYPRENLGE
ncbi:hypothetical protein BRY73_23935 [Ochrobactrum sp. P6BS-III]|uniref:transcriptional regulator n=1 Tax=unclassified Ochrobactrum TaxID=239106 RepID=UPI000991DC33|nr:DNA-binding transcriptional regulator YdaS (Cro superfamily) [Ochrobactrum sp. P6BSIII]OOL14287.1 hypothetical protein BRY73_23935 [Ochrobactrum sp. P6BS-III]